FYSISSNKTPLSSHPHPFVRLVDSAYDIQILMVNLRRLVSFDFIKEIIVCRTENEIIHRLHIILVVAILSMCYIFSTFTPRIITISTDKPSLKSYEDLSKQSYYTFECPCSHLYEYPGYYGTVCSSRLGPFSDHFLGAGFRPEVQTYVPVIY
ncbi:unnamed protein product, partial [Adineta ricciae]